MKTLYELKDKNSTLLRIFESEAAPRQNAFRVHHHVEAELSLILSGSGRYSARKLYPIASGDLFFYKNSEAHCITDVDAAGMRILNIHISPQYFRRLRSGNDEEFGVHFLQLSFAENRLAAFLPAAQYEELQRLMLRIREEAAAPCGYAALMVDSLLRAALITLARSALPRPAALKRRSCAGEELIFQSAAHIDEHFEEPLSLAALAAAVNLEKTYYSYLFKQTIGLSPFAYISIKRVERATELIRTTDRNMLDIALSCGFNNTANFNKIFKKYTGTTPKYFRK